MSLNPESTYKQKEAVALIGSKLTYSQVNFIPPQTPQIFINDITPSPEIYSNEPSIVTPNAIPANAHNHINDAPKTLSTGIVILPVEGGGRGPMQTASGELSTGLILSFLPHAIDEDELTQAYNQYIQSMHSAISNNTSQISSMYTSINNLHNEDSNLNTRINTNANNIQQNTAAISNLSGPVSTNTSSINSLATTVNLNTQRITLLEPKVNGLTPSIDQNTTDIQTLTSQLNSINIRIQANTDEISDVDDATMGMADDVSDATDSVAAMEITVASQEGQINANTAQLQGFQEQFDEFNTRIVENTNNLADLTIVVGDNSDAIAILQPLVTTNIINIGLLDTRVTELEDHINKQQSGYVTDSENVAIGLEWLTIPPKIDLIHSHGLFIVNPVTVNQERIFGHEGIRGSAGSFNFNVNAAILEYDAPTTINLNWTPTDVTAGHPAGTEEASTISALTTTTANCMGIRVKGELSLSNNVLPGVAGFAIVQMSIDDILGSEDWIEVYRLFGSFDLATGDWFTKPFDVQFAFPQDEHKYKFRLVVVGSDMDDITKEIIGRVHISDIIESGTGTILSNNIILQWKTKD